MKAPLSTQAPTGITVDTTFLSLFFIALSLSVYLVCSSAACPSGNVNAARAETSPVFSLSCPRRSSVNEWNCTEDSAFGGYVGQVSLIGQVILTSLCKGETCSGKASYAFSLTLLLGNQTLGVCSRPLGQCFGSVAKSCMSCYVPVACFSTWSRGEKFGRVGSSCPEVYMFPETVTSFA